MTTWKGGTSSDTDVSFYEAGGQRIEKGFTIHVDEPLEPYVVSGTSRWEIHRVL